MISNQYFFFFFFSLSLSYSYLTHWVKFQRRDQAGLGCIAHQIQINVSPSYAADPAQQRIGWLLWSKDAGWSSGFGGFSALGPADPLFFYLSP